MSFTPPFPPTSSAPYEPINISPTFASFEPQTALTVEFTTSEKDGSVESTPASSVTLQTGSGARLTWQQTQLCPSVRFPAEHDNPNATYTLILTDADAPNPNDTKYAYWRHWIQPGLRASSSPSEEARSDKAPLTEYLAPGKKEPLADPHRYLLLLYREPALDHPYHSLTKTDVGAEHFEARRAFDVKAWVEKHSLELVAVEWFWGTG